MGWLAPFAAAVGSVVARGAESFGAAACDPSGAVPAGAVAECAGLVGSLAVRLGVVAAGTVVLMSLMSIGLHRTALRLAEIRRHPAAGGSGPHG